MKEKIDLAIICCYNNEKQLNELLLESYNEQNVECEKILIDNSNNSFSSAAKALNYGASISKSNYYIFLHQDIKFLDSNSLKNIYEELKKCEGILGVAGVKENEKKVFTSIIHGKNKEIAGKGKIDKKEEVLTVDECLFGMSKTIYEKIKFDEQTCDNWHFYAVDLCLSASEQNIKSYIVPASIWHASIGCKNKSFYNSLQKMKEKYKGKRQYIKSCCIRADVNKPKYYTIIRDYLGMRYGKIKKFLSLQSYKSHS